MIRAVDAGPDVAYAEYAADPDNAEYCDDPDVDENMCAQKYYEEHIRVFGRSGSADYCWPEISFVFENESPIASPWPGLGSTTKPIGEFQFLEAFQNGNEIYMRGEQVQTKQIGMDGEEDINCSVKDEILVSIITPGGDPWPSLGKIVAPGGDPEDSVVDEGTEVPAKFYNNRYVGAFNSSDDAACATAFGTTTELVEKGFYSKVDMISVNPIPTP